MAAQNKTKKNTYLFASKPKINGIKMDSTYPWYALYTTFNKKLSLMGVNLHQENTFRNLSNVRYVGGFLFHLTLSLQNR